MQDETIILIVLQICNLLITILTPIIVALSTFLNHIKKSKCCNGSELEMRESFNKGPKTNNPPTFEIQAQDPHNLNEILQMLEARRQDPINENFIYHTSRQSNPNIRTTPTTSQLSREVSREDNRQLSHGQIPSDQNEQIMRDFTTQQPNNQTTHKSI